MSDVKPIYTADNIRIAYQLNYSLTLFSLSRLPEPSQWLEALRLATEADKVRILEYRTLDETTHQFLLSTQPDVTPAKVMWSVKGRWQYLVRASIPKAFRRNYRLESVGEANNATLQQYVAKQAERHRLIDPRIQARLESAQFLDRDVELSKIRTSSHGQYLFNLHLVMENREHLCDVRESSLLTTREMILRAMRKRNCQVARIGLVANHFHVLAGCCLEASPLETALSLMNNLAFAHAMTPILDDSFYVRTFGNFDRDAIRRCL